MVSRVFGIFVFGSNSSVVYRFVSDGLITCLEKGFQTRGYKIGTNNSQDQENADGELDLTFDDAISQHLNALIRVHEQSASQDDPIQRITLESGIQVFFDQIGENRVLCFADQSFDGIIVQKAISLLKALIKFHIGALPFIFHNVADKLIDRISAALQHFLNNVATNQALLFESCEYLFLNKQVRDQLNQICTTVSNTVQNLVKVSRRVVIITCKDKIAHLHVSSDQSLPSSADLFLLVLNNTSRSIREYFEAQMTSSSVMAHRYEPNTMHTDQNSPSSSPPPSARPSSTTQPPPLSERAKSCPTFGSEKFSFARRKEKRTFHSEVVFLRTGDRIIAPFTLFTIPVTEDISALVLVQWENSTVCSSLFQLIRQLDSNINHTMFQYNKLKPQVKAVESSAALRQCLSETRKSGNFLSETLANAHKMHKESAMDKRQSEDAKEAVTRRILRLMTDMSLAATDAFRRLFFDSDEYARRSGIDTKRAKDDDEARMDDVHDTDTKYRKNEYDTSGMTRELQSIINSKLHEWFSFIEVKAQRNITMNFYHNEFVGLVHFVFINRTRGRICTPSLIPDTYSTFSMNNNQELEFVMEKKILAFELECLSALQNGFTSYTVSDEHFVYNYTLLLQEANGASMPLYKSFIHYKPPSVLDSDFYKALTEENYPGNAERSAIECIELISVHLRFVPAHVVREHCENLWKKLMDPDE